MTIREETPADLDAIRQGECFMALELAPGALEGVDGTVRYPKAFAEDE